MRAPGGWLLPAAPTLRVSTPARLAAANSGADVTAETLPPDWDGRRLDLGYAVSVLLQPNLRQPVVVESDDDEHRGICA